MLVAAFVPTLIFTVELAASPVVEFSVIVIDPFAPGTTETPSAAAEGLARRNLSPNGPVNDEDVAKSISV